MFNDQREVLFESGSYKDLSYTAPHERPRHIVLSQASVALSIILVPIFIIGAGAKIINVDGGGIVVSSSMRSMCWRQV